MGHFTTSSSTTSTTRLYFQTGTCRAIDDFAVELTYRIPSGGDSFTTRREVLWYSVYEESDRTLGYWVARLGDFEFLGCFEYGGEVTMPYAYA